MITIPMNSKGAVERSSLDTINTTRRSGAFTAQNIGSLNHQTNSARTGTASGANPAFRQPVPPGQPLSAGQPVSPGQPLSSGQPISPGQPLSSGQPISPGQPLSSGQPISPGQPLPPGQPAPSAVPPKPIPPLVNPVQKGQKYTLDASGSLSTVRAYFGWNVNHAQCDVDVSAFLLNETGKVIGDFWFVFYGQTDSPDKTVQFFDNAPDDRESIKINLSKLNPSVKKIVFVLTINDAFANHLNFSMIKDAYVRIVNEADNKELVSFQMTEYYSNVISMMIGEIYQYNGAWKFNAVGNGVTRDLAGLCELYGVQVIN